VGLAHKDNCTVRSADGDKTRVRVYSDFFVVFGWGHKIDSRSQDKGHNTCGLPCRPFPSVSTRLIASTATAARSSTGDTRRWLSRARDHFSKQKTNSEKCAYPIVSWPKKGLQAARKIRAGAWLAFLLGCKAHDQQERRATQAGREATPTQTLEGT
jgi:hypothetical protein